jgi:hypothetical protein
MLEDQTRVSLDEWRLTFERLGCTGHIAGLLSAVASYTMALSLPSSRLLPSKPPRHDVLHVHELQWNDRHGETGDVTTR